MAAKKARTKEPKRRVRLPKLDEPWGVVKYIQKCMREAAKGEGEGRAAYRKVMMASFLLKALETASLEQRLAELEKLVRQKE